MFDPSKAIVSNAAAANNNTNDAKILQDLAVTFTGIHGWDFSLGQKKITLTEEGVRSSSELDFPERAQITRAVSDRRETGFFYKGDIGEALTLMGSVTSGTASNTLDDSNDSVNACGRADIKFLKGLNFGGSGCYSGGETVAHLERTRIAGHARFNGGGGFPLIAEAEYVYAKDGRLAQTDLRREGYYVEALYTFADAIQVGVRYDVITLDLNAQNGENGVAKKDSQIETWTFGIHWLAVRPRPVQERQPQVRLVQGPAGRSPRQRRPQRQLQPVGHRRAGGLLDQTRHRARLSRASPPPPAIRGFFSR